ncbi:MAG: vitamin K epoxide reductase family protein [Anaerolineae bacterium]
MTSTVSGKTSTTDSTPTSTGRNGLWVFSVILAIAGVLNTGYLVWTKLANTEVYCPPGSVFSCDLVQSSIYSRIGPIPIQYLGLLGYAAILGVLLLETRVPFFAQRGKLIVFGFTLFGFLYSAYLTGIEAFVLHAWCMYCLVSAGIMTVLFVVAFIRVWRSFGAGTADSTDLEATEAEA